MPADHPARRVVEAMRQLDLTPRFALYLGAGVPPVRPDLMLAIALIEIRSGRPPPSQWFRDTTENIVLQWAGFGFPPSRNLLIVHRAKPPPKNRAGAMLTTEEITT